MMKNNRIMRGIIAITFALVVFTMTATSAFAFTDGIAESGNTTPAATEQEPEPSQVPSQQLPQPQTTPTALTPNGNLSLVDDISGEQSESKQFVTFITKGGNYFYLIIDRAGDTENVYFLNLVDESDLMALIDKETPAQTTTPPAAEETHKPVSEPEPAPEPEPENNIGVVLGIILIAALLGGGALFYLKVLKPKKGLHGSADITEFDGFDFGDDEDDDSFDEDDDEAGAYAEVTFGQNGQEETEDEK